MTVKCLFLISLLLDGAVNGFQNEEAHTFPLSLPQYDFTFSDRDLAKRLATPIPWTYGNYSRLPGLENTSYPVPLPAGGSIITMRTQVFEVLLSQIGPALIKYFALKEAPFQLKCRSMDLGGDCIKKVSDFDKLYGALLPSQRSASAGFDYNDYAFAQRYVTFAPLLLTLVPDISSIPFNTSDILGLNSIIASTNHTLDELIQLKRIFIVDFTNLAPYAEPSADTYLELSAGLFFVDGCLEASCGLKRAIGRLMPLAVGFPGSTPQEVISPKDPPLAWLLAKGSLNMLQRDVGAVVHGLNTHAVLAVVCASGKINLPPAHPLSCLLGKLCSQNLGILSQAFSVVWADGGAYEPVHLLSAKSVREKILPFLMSQYNWTENYFFNDLAARGVGNIPGYLYRDDGKKLVKAFNDFSFSFLSLFYVKGDLDVQQDDELQDFANDLHKYVPGFPLVKDFKTLVEVLTHIMFMPSFHAAQNNRALWDSYFIYPMTPAKYTQAMPVDKNITEAEVMSKYLTPAVPKGKSDVELIFQAISKQSSWGTATISDLKGADQVPKHLQDKAQEMISKIEAATTRKNEASDLFTPYELFSFSMKYASGYIPQSFYFRNNRFNYCPAALLVKGFPQIANALGKSLRSISMDIRRRNRALGKNPTAPEYALLDAASIPNYTQI